MKKWNLMKTVLTAALGAAMLFPAVGAAELTSAPADGAAQRPAYELQQRGVGEPVRVWGQAVELGELSLTLQNDNEGDSYQKIVLNVAEDTLILDAVSGESRTFADIQKDEILYAWVGPVMTKSLPPITTARVILCGIPTDYHVPTFAEVQSVTETEQGVDVYMTGDVVLHLNAGTELLAGEGWSGEAALDAIHPGDRLLSWYSFVALSMPAQAGPEKVMVFPSQYAGWVSADGLAVSVNGKALDLTGANAAKVENDRLMVPVRAVAEALGCEIAWEPYTNRVTVTKDGGELYHFAIGETEAAQGELTVGLLAPAAAADGVTFMALDDLLVLHNLKLETNWF